MNIAVCEDHSRDASELVGHLQRHMERNGYTADIHCFESGEALLHAFKPGAFDSVFMDIYMTGLTGIETAKKLRALDRNFALVFVSVSDEHAREAYSLRACAYVSKPIEQDELALAFSQCEHMFIKNARFIEIISQRRSVKLPLAKIIYVEVYNRNVIFHTTNGAITATMTLDEVEQTCGAAFLRCHRSYVINLNQVQCFNEQDILMKNGEIVPMRQRGRQQLRNIYGKFLTDSLFELGMR